MAAVKHNIRDGGTLVAMPVPGPSAAPLVRAADADAVAIPSPARVLQERLHQRSIELDLPSHHHGRSSQRDLGAFILGATLLWGATLGGIYGLLCIAS
jgi:hypothetical protein